MDERIILSLLRGAASGPAARTLSYENARVFTAWFPFHFEGLTLFLAVALKLRLCLLESSCENLRRHLARAGH